MIDGYFVEQCGLFRYDCYRVLNGVEVDSVFAPLPIVGLITLKIRKYFKKETPAND